MKRIVLALPTIFVLTIAGVARAETAAESFANGQKLLTKGDFDAALKAFGAAARADQKNQEYTQRYAITRRIVDLRGRLAVERDPQKWEYMARALRAFYVKERIYPEVLKLDEAMHKRLNTSESAAMLAETQLAMDRNADAVKTLSAVKPNEATEMTQLLLGIAQARSGKKDQASRIAEKIELPKDASPSVTYTAARLYAAVGNSPKAITLMKLCFEGTLPSLLDGFKAHARTCPDFAAMVATAEFASVLKTESTVPESKCSGGSSCAGCPMRGSCPKSQGK
jgi:tetratricopeptide (TPR) repeat protein